MTVHGSTALRKTLTIEAAEAGAAPPVVLASTRHAALELMNLALLKRYAQDLV